MLLAKQGPGLKRPVNLGLKAKATQVEASQAWTHGKEARGFRVLSKPMSPSLKRLKYHWERVQLRGSRGVQLLGGQAETCSQFRPARNCVISDPCSSSAVLAPCAGSEGDAAGAWTTLGVAGLRGASQFTMEMTER